MPLSGHPLNKLSLSTKDKLICAEGKTEEKKMKPFPTRCPSPKRLHLASVLMGDKESGS
jgi:hypothetical protein